jgi:hypothetical protein
MNDTIQKKTINNNPYLVSYDPHIYTPLTEEGEKRAEISFDGMDFCTPQEVHHLIDNAGKHEQNLGFIVDKARARKHGANNQQVLKAILSCLVEASWEYTLPFEGMRAVKDVLAFYGFSEDESNLFPDTTLLRLLDAAVLLRDAGVTSISTKDH